VELSDTERRSANWRNRACSLPSSNESKLRTETTSLLRGHDNDDDDSDNVPSLCHARTGAQHLPAQTSATFDTSTSTTHSSDLRTRWTTLKRWFLSSSTPTPAIGLNDLRARHLRLPVRTDVEAASARCSDPVVRLSSAHDDEDLLSTTRCCFVRSRDSARLTSESPGVAVCAATAMHVGSVVSTDTISTSRLLCDSSGAALTAAAAVNAACEPLLSAPARSARSPSDDDDDAARHDCLTTSTTSRRLRDSGIAFIDEDDRL